MYFVLAKGFPSGRGKKRGKGGVGKRIGSVINNIFSSNGVSTKVSLVHIVFDIYKCVSYDTVVHANEVGFASYPPGST